MEMIKHQLLLLHSLVNVEDCSEKQISHKKLLDSIKMDFFKTLFINFLEELTKT